MEKLSINWITEKHIDFEYKKYLLLSYLQKVSSEFDQNRLYPYFTDVEKHYKQLAIIKENTEIFSESFPKNLSGIDWNNLSMIYKSTIKDDLVMNHINEVVKYSLPLFANSLDEGKEICAKIETHINIDPVGIVPLSTNEGYIILKNGDEKQVRVYQYQITIYDGSDEKYKKMHTEYIKAYRMSFSNTCYSIKSDLIRKNKQLPNPATYSVETDVTLPFNETFLPVAKKTLVSYIDKHLTHNPD